MKRFSILIPSRGRPNDLANCILNIFQLADNPDAIEVIVRLDIDDPELHNYLSMAIPYVFYIVGPRYGGYAENHRLIEEAARFSQGFCIMQLVDTARMETKNWDSIVWNLVCLKAIFVLSTNVGGGHLYKWSFPMIPRYLYQLCGRFCLGDNPSVDRCWEQFAIEMNCEIHADIEIAHHEKRNTCVEDRTAKETQPFYAELNNNWDKRFAEFKAIGKQYAEIVRSKL